jgi:RNA recognition motif-containing protein
METNRLFIANLAWSTEDAELRAAFEAHGQVTRARVVCGADGRSRGFGFVEFETPEEASAAMSALNGAEIGGRPIRVEPSHDSKPRRGDW